MKKRTLTIKQLTAFCSTDASWSYIAKPFSYGRHTYATNGHILVRVARFKRVGCLIDAPGAQCARIMRAVARGAFIDVPKAAGPASIKGVSRKLLVGKAVVDVKYCRAISRLAKARIVAAQSECDAIYFKFDGGDGCVMPMKVDKDDPLIINRPATSRAA